MGYFSYQCNGCKNSIRFDGIHGEWCVLQHVRHGKLVGQAEGEYNGEGGIIGNLVFRHPSPANPNSQQEIDRSEALPDSRKELGAFAMSGIAAWHKKCYYEAPETKRNALLISRSDGELGSGTSLEPAIVEMGNASIMDVLMQNGFQPTIQASHITITLPSGHTLVLREYELRL
jgi:hypothetical protein